LYLLAGAAATAGRARAAEEVEGAGGEGVVGAIKSLFDPNEETKAGKVLPKAYLKAAREVVRTLRESLEEKDAAGDSAKFRRGADSAKVSIREFLGGWRGQQSVAKEVILQLSYKFARKMQFIRFSVENCKSHVKLYALNLQKNKPNLNAMQESYVALEKAIRSLAEFYSKAGPFASLPGDVKNKILDDLNAAEAYL
jgi:hypothetical protein